MATTMQLNSTWTKSGHVALRLLIAVAAVDGLPALCADATNTNAPPAVTIVRTNYHNWPGSIVMGNGKVEVVIVPAIGRIMQFKFVGDDDGTLWNNRSLDGQAPDPDASDWRNFGGDKTWPAPQNDWQKFTGHSWPPPPAFDSLPLQATISQGTVTLVSPVDPFYGVRTVRQIHLAPDQPVMRIETSYQKVQGTPQPFAVWVVTQASHPVGIYLPEPSRSIFPNSCHNLGPALPPSLRTERGLLSLARDPKGTYKIGSDADAVLWVGEKTVLLIQSPRGRDPYPDGGCSAEVYTNPDDQPYVELELLAPLRTMKVGDQAQLSSTYTLFRRTSSSPETQAREILGR